MLNSSSVLATLAAALVTDAAVAGAARPPAHVLPSDGRVVLACHPGTGEPAKRRALVKLYAATMPDGISAVAGVERQTGGALETKLIVAEQAMVDAPQVQYTEVVRDGKTMTCAHLAN